MKRLKNLTAVLAALAMMFSAAGGIPSVQHTDSESLIANAETSADGLWEYYIAINSSTGEQTITLSGYNSTESDVVIPAEIDGIPVTDISISDYSWNTIPTSLTIPGTIEKLSTSLLPRSLKEIIIAEDNPNYSSKDGILYNQDATELLYVPTAKILDDFTIPDSVTSIGKQAFSNCENLTSVTIPDSVKSIGKQAFNCCTSLENIYIEGTLDYIGYSAFERTPYLENLLAENTDYIIVGGILLDVGTALQEETHLTLPEGITGIASGIFTYNPHMLGTDKFLNLTSVDIPEGVTSISNGAFMGCRNLTSVNIPDSVTEIQPGAFYQCTNLTSIKIPESVTRIEGMAFSECTALESINIPEKIQEIGIDAFAKTPWFADKVQESPLTIFNGILLDVNTELLDHKLIIPDGITTINPFTSLDKEEIEYMVIPSSVKSISERLFSFVNAPSGFEIYYAGSEEEWNAIEITTPSLMDFGFLEYEFMLKTQAEYHVNYNSTDPASGEVPEELKQGDANGDGEVDILDVIAVNKAILGKGSLTEAQLKAIDFNGNGKPDPEESLTLLKFIVGLITEFE